MKMRGLWALNQQNDERKAYDLSVFELTTIERLDSKNRNSDSSTTRQQEETQHDYQTEVDETQISELPYLVTKLYMSSKG